MTGPASARVDVLQQWQVQLEYKQQQDIQQMNSALADDQRLLLNIQITRQAAILQEFMTAIPRERRANPSPGQDLMRLLDNIEKAGLFINN